VRAFTIIDVLSIKIIDGRFAGRGSVGRESGRRIVRGQSRHPAAKVLRFGADPEGWKKRGRRCGQPPPALRSRPLGRRSGCSSAEPYPPPSASSVGGSVPGRGPFRSLFIYSGERERSRGGQPQRCQPAGVRRSRPARSSDSRASPKRSFFTPSASRSFARESTTPGVSRSSTWSWRGRCC
jgi:hypothetical protein